MSDSETAPAAAPPAAAAAAAAPAPMTAVTHFFKKRRSLSRHSAVWGAMGVQGLSGPLPFCDMNQPPTCPTVRGLCISVCFKKKDDESFFFLLVLLRDTLCGRVSGHR